MITEQCAESPPGELPYKSAGGLHDDDLFRERLRNMGKSKSVISCFTFCSFDIN